MHNPLCLIAIHSDLGEVKVTLVDQQLNLKPTSSLCAPSWTMGMSFEYHGCSSTSMSKIFVDSNQACQHSMTFSLTTSSLSNFLCIYVFPLTTIESSTQNHLQNVESQNETNSVVFSYHDHAFSSISSLVGHD